MAELKEVNETDQFFNINIKKDFLESAKAKKSKQFLQKNAARLDLKQSHKKQEETKQAVSEEQMDSNRFDEKSDLSDW